MEAITIPKGFRVTPEQFDQLAQAEQLSRMELTKDGELIIMSPTGGTAGGKNFNLYLDLGIWNRQQRDSTSRNEFGVSRAQTKLGQALYIELDNRWRFQIILKLYREKMFYLDLFWI